MHKPKSILRYNDKISTRYIGSVFITDSDYKNGMLLFLLMLSYFEDNKSIHFFN